MLMSKAMNRSFANVLFGAFGSQWHAGAVGCWGGSRRHADIR
jgi:NAD/NADP transhydrogenase beta subunit